MAMGDVGILERFMFLGLYKLFKNEGFSKNYFIN